METMRTVLRKMYQATLLGAVLFACVFSGTLVRAQPEVTPLTDSERDKVAANCVAIKSSLHQLHATDALLRVNRGRVYEALATKLMEPFNTRLASNKLDNGAMTTVTAQYRAALDTFRTDYIAYEQKLSAALKIDCASQPDAFHLAVSEARGLRTTVHTDVQKLHRIIDDYKMSVGDFLLNYERVSQ